MLARRSRRKTFFGQKMRMFFPTQFCNIAVIYSNSHPQPYAVARVVCVEKNLSKSSHLLNLENPNIYPEKKKPR